MKYLTALPSPQLSPYILKYYQVIGITSNDSPYQEFTLPNALTSFVFHFRKPIEVSNVSYDGKKIPEFYIFGKYTKPIFVSHTFGKVDVFGVIFQPGSFRYFLRLPQNELTNQLLDVREGFGNKMGDLVDRMAETQDFHNRISLIEAYFKKRLSCQAFNFDKVAHVLAIIYQKCGNIQVQKLAKEVGLSRQYLNKLFLEREGLNVKEYTRIVRFNCALKAITSNNPIDIMQAVLDFGYHDQSHLIKDFHHFTQGRPKDFFQKENQLAKFLMNQ